MNEKDKAQEIYNAFYMILFDSESDKGQEILISDLAKKCALKSAEQTVSVIPVYTVGLNPKWKFWQGVLIEIEKINT